MSSYKYFQFQIQHPRIHSSLFSIFVTSFSDSVKPGSHFLQDVYLSHVLCKWPTCCPPWLSYSSFLGSDTLYPQFPDVGGAALLDLSNQVIQEGKLEWNKQKEGFFTI